MINIHVYRYTYVLFYANYDDSDTCTERKNVGEKTRISGHSGLLQRDFLYTRRWYTFVYIIRSRIIADKFYPQSSIKSIVLNNNYYYYHHLSSYLQSIKDIIYKTKGASSILCVPAFTSC